MTAFHWLLGTSFGIKCDGISLIQINKKGNWSLLIVLHILLREEMSNITETNKQNRLAMIRCPY